MINTLDILPNIYFEEIVGDELFSILFLVIYIQVNAFSTHVAKQTILAIGKARQMASLSFYLNLEWANNGLGFPKVAQDSYKPTKPKMLSSVVLVLKTELPIQYFKINLMTLQSASQSIAKANGLQVTKENFQAQ